MGKKEELKNKLKEKSKKAKEIADEILRDDLEQLRKATSSNLEGLRPKVKDKKSYDLLINAVNESTNNNENLAALKNRIEKLGPAVISVAKEVLSLI